jgi:hypothetical protein
MRGRSATTRPAAAAAAATENGGSGPRPASAAATRPPHAAPAPRRVTTRPGIGTVLMRVTWVSPKRSSVAGSTRPPSTESPPSTRRKTARSWRGLGRSSGSGWSAASIASHSSAGMSRRLEASPGRRLPTRLAVAAGLAARTGLEPVHAS